METTGSSSGGGSECSLLRHSGLGIRFEENKTSTFHHKVIIIDGKIVIFGSYNFSDSAEVKNDENVLIVHDEGFAQAFEQEFMRLWDLSPVANCN
jgi:phosphatidylserine/phosphatidylglycerophosphate/cardiolipin synthase-like enzyme